MTLAVIVDTGPLVAYFDANDHQHDWTRDHLQKLTSPLLTCEAVLSEVCFLLNRARLSPQRAIDAVARGSIRLSFSLAEEFRETGRLMTRYADAGISLADACLVRMSELHPQCRVMTCDRDFLVYRRLGRRAIPLLAPFQE